MAEIAALSGVKPNFGGGGIRAGVKRAGVMKADKVCRSSYNNVTEYESHLFFQTQNILLHLEGYRHLITSFNKVVKYISHTRSMHKNIWDIA